MLDFVVSSLKKKATAAISSPAARKLMGDPRVQRTVMKAINLRADIHKRIEGQVKGFASSYNLVTRSDIATLRRTIRELESTVAALQKQARDAGGNTEVAEAPAAGEGGRRRRPARRE
jgi:polyhydroxyalkanoate synthesis regulator phasin